MDFERSLLCCEEFLLPSPLPSPPYDSPPSPSLLPHLLPSFSTFSPFPVPVPGDDDLTIGFLMSNFSQCWPQKSYASDLKFRPPLAEARCNAVRWMIKAHFMLKFRPLTVALAVNYMDRYLEKNLSMPWKSWMMELLSVACLSVAAKMEEVDVPALLDLQIDGTEHLFQAKTVQRMELNVLSSLSWRLRSVTSFTFLEKAIDHLDLSQKLKSSLMARTSELVLAALAELELLDFEPHLIAVASLCCALDEIVPVQTERCKLLVLEYIPMDLDRMRNCYLLMESLIVDPLSSPTLTWSGHLKLPLSPNSVVYHCSEDDSSSVGNAIRSQSFLSQFYTESIESQEYARGPKRRRLE